MKGSEANHHECSETLAVMEGPASAVSEAWSGVIHERVVALLAVVPLASSSAPSANKK